MKKIISLFSSIFAVLLFLFPLSSSSQIVLTGGVSGSDLADILAGEGVAIMNVTFNCPDGASGSFANGDATNIGLNTGVVLTSGRISDIPGPNTAGNTSWDNGGGGDADLTAASGFSTENACILEFDFIPSASGLSVKYVFASEEYNEYVCSEFNDVFAFFVTGPNPSGPDYANQNIALVPGVGSPVTINSINNGSPGSNSDGSPCDLSNAGLYTDNTGGATIEYDGFSHVLTAELELVPCQTYHFKFAIADASDEILDSGVFIDAASFETNSIVATATDSPEGCPGGEITFTSTLTNVTGYTINIDVLESSTATATDYAAFALNHMLPAGQQSLTVPIVSIADILNEGNETINFEFTYDAGCDPTTDYASALIVDGPITCNDFVLNLGPLGTGSITPDDVLTGDLDAICPQFGIDLTKEDFVCLDEGINIVTVTATDVNGNESQCNSDVTVVVPPNILSIDLGDACRHVYLGYEPLECVDITASVSGGTPPYSYVWSNGEVSQTITVCPSVTTFYDVTVTDINGCDEVSGFAEVEVIDVRCGKENDKVLVCHIPTGNPENQHTICISASAVPAHFAHGDVFLGNCGDIPCDEIDPLTMEASSLYPMEPSQLSKAEQADGLELTVYPNPSSQSLVLNLNGQGMLRVEILDVKGNVLFTDNTPADHNGNYILPPSLTLEPGYYFARVHSIDHRVIVKRFVKF